jgi:hypothetical protein
MYAIEKILESSYSAIILAAVLGGLALSGRFSVIATQLLFVAAWGVALIGLWGQPWPIFLGSLACLGGGLFLLAYWARPDAIPSFSGMLSPKATLLYPPSAGGTIPKLQIDDSGVFIVAPGGGPFSLLFPALEASKFKVESIDGKIKFSTDITDANGDLIAEIIRNEWKVSALGRAWDHNYSDDALEVKDSKGRVVLQVRALPDRIQIQGAWYIDMGPPNGIRRVIICKDQTQPDAQIVFTPPDAKNIPSIPPMFKYPSDRHLGELRQ